jgi:phosphoribosylamine---glycine ligase
MKEADQIKNIAILGEGAREHMLGLHLLNYHPGTELTFLSGNAGTKKLGRNLNFPQNLSHFLTWAKEAEIDLVIPGSEVYIYQGVTDVLEAAGIPTFSPFQKASQIEAKKAFSAKVCADNGIPQPGYFAPENVEDALKAISRLDWERIVVKPDGPTPTLGKGVVVTRSKEEAASLVIDYMVNDTLKGAGKRVFLQEAVSGQEVSAVVMTDGRNVLWLPPARDDKLLNGKNTGGMFSFAPIEEMTTQKQEEVNQTIFYPFLDGLNRLNTPFRGALFAGLMETEEGFKVLEFNCRFGDPETQAQLPLVDQDLVPLMLACRNGTLYRHQIKVRPGAQAAAVLAAAGYPDQTRTGDEIFGLNLVSSPHVTLTHAGTKQVGNKVLTSGGRVLTVSGWGESLAEARQRAHQSADLIEFAGKQKKTVSG